MSSSSQVLQCQTIAKQALDDVVSLGTRLYGYKINKNPNYKKPLLIKNRGDTHVIVNKAEIDTHGVNKSCQSPYSGDNDACNVNVHSKYEKVFQELTGNSISGSIFNAGMPFITNPADSTTQPIEIAPSVMLVNSVNFLQYLYNSDADYSTGDGKLISLSSTIQNSISDLLEKYKEQFNLANVKFYIKITPVDLKENKLLDLTKSADLAKVKCQKTYYKQASSQFVTEDYTCPKKSGSHTLILTRPLLPDLNDLMSKSAFQDRISKDLVLLGNPDLGFEIKALFKYESNSQNFYCEAMHRFAHQHKAMTGKLKELSGVSVTSIKNGAGQVLYSNPPPASPTPNPLYKRKLTSCDTDGTGYKNITIQIDFGGLASNNPEAGTLLLCQGQVACRSTGESNYPGCTVKKGAGGNKEWQRCHNFKFPDQSGSTQAKLLSAHKLELTFNSLQDNRRYDLYITEASYLELARPHRLRGARFYIDAKRPEGNSDYHFILGDEVGLPRDGIKGRNYAGTGQSEAHEMDDRWNVPDDALSDKWIQCQSDLVIFEAQSKDQFIHNLSPCTMEAHRRDGTNRTGTGSVLTVSIEPDPPPDPSDPGIYNQKKQKEIVDLAVADQAIDFNSIRHCRGKVSTDHGRHTITYKHVDVCDTGKKSKLTWDTDLASTFAKQGFTNAPAPLSFSEDGIFWTAPYVTSPTTAHRYLYGHAVQIKNPATGKGQFPKHYAGDCVGRWYGTGDHDFREDGYQYEGGSTNNLTCFLWREPGPSHTVDRMMTIATGSQGCKKSGDMTAEIAHVCGARQCLNAASWGTYALIGQRCQNIRCHRDDICCNPDNDDGAGAAACGTLPSRHDPKHEIMEWSSTVGVGYCQANSPENRRNSKGVFKCDDPKGGSDQDHPGSICPPLGLYNCSYNIPCNAKSPCSENDVDLGFPGCQGKRKNASCSYQRTGTCVPNSTGWNSSCQKAGSYTIGCDSGSCTVNRCNRRCPTPCTHTCYDTCCSTCTRTDCNSKGVCTTVSYDCNCRDCNPHRCHPCDAAYQYQAQPSPLTKTFSGTCGSPHSSSPGCKKKTHKPIGSENATCSLSRTVNGCGGGPPPCPSQGSDEYTTRSLCESGKPTYQECYKASRCYWKRRDICTGGYTTIAQCQNNLPPDCMCYTRNGCVERRCIPPPKTPVDGACGILNCRQQTCHQGGPPGVYIPNPLPADYRCSWKCVGEHGGATDRCVVTAPGELCECGSNVNTCTKGDSNDTTDTTTHRKWDCVSNSDCNTLVPCQICNESNGYYDTKSRCEINLPVSKECHEDNNIGCWRQRDKLPACECDTSVSYNRTDANCKHGRHFIEPNDSDTEFKWTCRSSHPKLCSGPEVECSQPKPACACNINLSNNFSSINPSSLTRSLLESMLQCSTGCSPSSLSGQLVKTYQARDIQNRHMWTGNQYNYTWDCVGGPDSDYIDKTGCAFQYSYCISAQYYCSSTNAFCRSNSVEGECKLQVCYASPCNNCVDKTCLLPLP